MCKYNTIFARVLKVEVKNKKIKKIGWECVKLKKNVYFCC